MDKNLFKNHFRCLEIWNECIHLSLYICCIENLKGLTFRTFWPKAFHMCIRYLKGLGHPKALFVTYTIIQSITSSEMCSLHLTRPSTHTSGAVGSRHSSARCLAQGSHLSHGQFLPQPRFEPTTSDYKSDALAIRATTAHDNYYYLISDAALLTLILFQTCMLFLLLLNAIYYHYVLPV